MHRAPCGARNKYYTVHVKTQVLVTQLCFKHAAQPSLRARLLKQICTCGLRPQVPLSPLSQWLVAAVFLKSTRTSLAEVDVHVAWAMGVMSSDEWLAVTVTFRELERVIKVKARRGACRRGELLPGTNLCNQLQRDVCWQARRSFLIEQLCVLARRTDACSLKCHVTSFETRASCSRAWMCRMCAISGLGSEQSASARAHWTRNEANWP